MVQDPNFWRRFSLAVHQDDLSKSPEHTGDLKHSYVDPSPPSPTSQHNLLSPALPSSPSLPTIALAPAPPAHVVPLRQEEIWQSEFEAEKVAAMREHKEKDAPKRRPSKLQKSASRASRRPLLSRSSSTFSRNTSYNFPASTTANPQTQTHTYTYTTTTQTNTPLVLSPVLQRPPSALSFLRNPSTLSLSGRRGTVFKTWTEITANPVSSDSWLAGQKKKSKQRAWICWCFWLTFLVLVAGVVVAVLVLKSHGII